MLETIINAIVITFVIMLYICGAVIMCNNYFFTGIWFIGLAMCTFVVVLIVSIIAESLYDS